MLDIWQTYWRGQTKEPLRYHHYFQNQSDRVATTFGSFAFSKRSSRKSQALSIVLKRASG